MALSFLPFFPLRRAWHVLFFGYYFLFMDELPVQGIAPAFAQPQQRQHFLHDRLLLVPESGHAQQAFPVCERFHRFACAPGTCKVLPEPPDGS